MRRIIAATGAAAALFLASPGGAWAITDAQRHNPFGVVDHTLHDELVRVGAVWMRQPESVFYLESAPGNWDWTSWDEEIGTELEPRGLLLSPVVTIGKCWMSGFNEATEYPSMPPADLTSVWSPATGYSATYYDYIWQLVSRYRGRLDHLTIENEANAPNFWGGTADQYCRLLKTAHLAAHNADPDITVFDSGMGSGVWGACILRDRYESGLYSQSELLDFANAYYDRDVYTNVHFPDFASLTSWLYSSFVNDQYQRAIFMLANMKDGVDAMNLKFTEYWWLYEDVVNYLRMKTGAAGWQPAFLCNNEASNWIGVSDDQEARELVQKYVVGLSLGVERTLWFPLSWQTDPSRVRVPLLDADGLKLPAYFAYQSLARIVGSEFAFDRLDLSRPQVREYRFTSRTNPGHGLSVVWWDDGTHGSGSAAARFRLPSGTSRVVRSDYLGTRVASSVRGEDFLELQVSEWPMAIETFADSLQAAPGGLASAGGLLEQNAPNPFNPETSIRFSVPGSEGTTMPVHLDVYDVGGARVRTLVSGDEPAGVHAVVWRGETDAGGSAPPGVYLYRLRVGDAVESRKMILVP